ncbi:Helicase PriA essential for oriC/DnaA-independent DNA replication [Mucinivorans hirudinis]|uniref:Probable replication restart protein PriA n=1 Tax=Mucinivorans hirudinis TaxID=1433126 RepID=A0A060REF4_9BACT|nr:Helicase PriA essential for oriC/DnaA-independent DNA replication [Mucinivorans hirudinis]
MFYPEILLDLALPATLTYATQQSVAIGARVRVSLNRRMYIGVVVSVSNEQPEFKTLPIEEIIDTEEVFITPEQIELWRWIADYYIVPLGVVYGFVMPKFFRDGALSPKQEDFVTTVDNVNYTAELENLKRAKKQQDLLGKIIGSETPLSKKEISEKTILKNLLDKGLVKIVSENQKLKPIQNANQPANELYDLVKKAFEKNDKVLLFEREQVDKTELYCKLITENSRQTLILLPDGFSAEALYEQINAILGGGVVLYTPLIASERQRQQTFLYSVRQARAVVGSWTALFLPMQELGLVVIEQEQDAAYKIRENSPRLNLRDAALVRAAKEGALTLLTSEAPSVESYYNATRGLWEMVYYQPSEPRKVEFMVLERGKELLSKYLRKRIEEALERGQQALVFQNRRGFSMWVECSDCADIPTCEHCNVSLTYHKADNTLRCHYCGYLKTFNHRCEKCKSTNIIFQGRGTERIEESLQEIFPAANVVRLDYDSTRARGSFEQIAAAVATASCDIIVGTQMVVRGLDFRRISVVGIANADNMLSQPDFRNAERAFTLLTQLSNRIGSSEGEVIIQTTKRLDAVIKAVAEQNPRKFYEIEIAQREALHYPPFTRNILITITHPDRHTLYQTTQELDSKLREIFGSRLSSPFEPSVERQQERYYLQFYLRIERAKSTARAKEFIKKIVSELPKSPLSTIVVDVDPV